MKILSDQELVRQIRADDIKPCYLFYGRDVATLESITKKLINKLVPPEARDLNYHFFPSGALDINALMSAMSAFPMFSDRVVAAINDFDADKAPAKDVASLKEIISEIDPETSTLIIYATAVDLCGGKKALTAANKKLAEHIEKCGGTVVEFAFKTPAELAKYIISSVAKNGSTISQPAAVRLAESCRSNLLMINNEIAKLSSYRKGEEITEHDIRDLVTGQIETDAYKLARAVTSGNKVLAFSLLDDLYSLQKETNSLLLAISNSFIDLYRAKLALISGRGSKDIEAEFSYRGREFAITNAMRDCARIPIERLRNCLSILSECDIGIKSLRTDDRIQLEKAITKMMG